MTPETMKRRRVRKHSTRARKRRNIFNRLLEDRLIQRVSFEKYRQKVRNVYDGPKGAILATCSLLSLHVPLGKRLFRTRKFNLRGVRQVLDVGSGAGQLVRHVLEYADPGTRVTGFDLSHEMLRRARRRVKSGRAHFVAADLTNLPFPDETFDCVTCGYVLEHLPDAKIGLGELSRVMMPRARMLLMTTEDNFSGAMTSRMWCCRTYNRRELARICEDLHLRWKQELWFSPMHKVLRAGGICVELVKE